MMKYYSDAAGTEVFAFEDDGSQGAFIAPDMIAITPDQADAIRFPPPTESELAAARIAKIKARLDGIDKGLIRGLDEGTATEEDEARLAELRAEKRALEGAGG